jgi:peptidoglycan/LPS O-acetylase OafA/YrhL
MSVPRFREDSTIALLDLLRAGAAFSVLAWHSSDLVGVKMPLFSSAAWAVDLFMVISGFLMMHHFRQREEKERWEDPRTWRTFWIRRFFRIAPLYYVVLLVAWILRGSGHESPSAQFLFFVTHLTFTFGFIPGQVEVSGLPDWSLALEMQFYLVFPFLALAVRRMGAGKFFCACAVVALAANRLIGIYETGSAGWLGWWPQPSLLPLKIHVFAFGMVLAEGVHRGVGAMRGWSFWIALALVLPASRFNYMKVEWACWVGILFLAAAPRIGALAYRWMMWIESVLRKWPVFRWPAELSYGIYLIHALVLHSVFSKWGVEYGFSFLPVHFLMLVVSVTVVSAAIALPLFLIVERGGIRLGRQIAGFKSRGSA